MQLWKHIHILHISNYLYSISSKTHGHGWKWLDPPNWAYQYFKSDLLNTLSHIVSVMSGDSRSKPGSGWWRHSKVAVLCWVLAVCCFAVFLPSFETKMAFDGLWILMTQYLHHVCSGLEDGTWNLMVVRLFSFWKGFLAILGRAFAWTLTNLNMHLNRQWFENDSTCQQIFWCSGQVGLQYIVYEYILLVLVKNSQELGFAILGKSNCSSSQAFALGVSWSWFWLVESGFWFGQMSEA